MCARRPPAPGPGVDLALGATLYASRYVQMRGEMMKAMGEVMMKYGKMMKSGRR